MILTSVSVQTFFELADGLGITIIFPQIAIPMKSIKLENVKDALLDNFLMTNIQHAEPVKETNLFMPDIASHVLMAR